MLTLDISSCEDLIELKEKAMNYKSISINYRVRSLITEDSEVSVIQDISTISNLS